MTYEKTFTSFQEGPSIRGHVMTDKAADILAQACGLDNADSLKKECIKCGVLTHSQLLHDDKPHEPCCPRCLDEVLRNDS